MSVCQLELDNLYFGVVDGGEEWFESELVVVDGLRRLAIGLMTTASELFPS